MLDAGSLRIAPKPDSSLGYAKAEWKSPCGTIRSEWKYLERTLLFRFSTPIPASILLPNGQTYDVKAGEYSYEISV